MRTFLENYEWIFTDPRVGLYWVQADYEDEYNSIDKSDFLGFKLLTFSKAGLVI